MNAQNTGREIGRISFPSNGHVIRLCDHCDLLDQAYRVTTTSGMLFQCGTLSDCLDRFMVELKNSLIMLDIKAYNRVFVVLSFEVYRYQIQSQRTGGFEYEKSWPNGTETLMFGNLFDAVKWLVFQYELDIDPLLAK